MSIPGSSTNGHSVRWENGVQLELKEGHTLKTHPNSKCIKMLRTASNAIQMTIAMRVSDCQVEFRREDRLRRICSHTSLIFRIEDEF